MTRLKSLSASVLALGASLAALTPLAATAQPAQPSMAVMAAAAAPGPSPYAQALGGPSDYAVSRDDMAQSESRTVTPEPTYDRAPDRLYDRTGSLGRSADRADDRSDGPADVQRRDDPLGRPSPYMSMERQAASYGPPPYGAAAGGAGPIERAPGRNLPGADAWDPAGPYGAPPMGPVQDGSPYGRAPDPVGGYGQPAPMGPPRPVYAWPVYPGQAYGGGFPAPAPVLRAEERPLSVQPAPVERPLARQLAVPLPAPLPLSGPTPSGTYGAAAGPPLHGAPTLYAYAQDPMPAAGCGFVVCRTVTSRLMAAPVVKVVRRRHAARHRCGCGAG